MSRSALHEISSYHALKAAWDSIYFKANAAQRETCDINGVSLRAFSAYRDSGLRKITKELRSTEGYQFSPLRAVLLQKPNGKYRVICIPTVPDRIVQRALILYLADGDKCRVKNDVSYGFIPGRSVEHAARKAKKLRRKHPWVYKADITKFFDSISRTHLNEAVDKAVQQKSLRSVISAAISSEIHESNVKRKNEIRLAGIKKGVGVRQGMPLSPLLANIVLRDFDKSVQSKNIRMIRYADDLVVFCDSESECQDVHQVFVAELSKLGLEIPDPDAGSKTKIYKPDDTAEFLGVGLTPNGPGYSLDVQKTQIDKIRKVISALSNFDELAKKGISIGGFVQKLDGVISGYQAVYDYCDNAKQLGQVLNRAKVYALTNVYEKGLGLELASMSESQRAFLGIRPI